MGIVALLGTALKNLPWRTLATVALDHAPELYQKAKERFQHEPPPDGSAVETELQEKITHLQRLLIDQKQAQRELEEKYARLEKQCATLEARLFSCKVVIGVLFIAVMLLLALVLK